MSITINEIGLKRCRNCGRELPLDNFYQHESSPDGYRCVCKHCYIERQQRKKCGEDHITKHRIKRTDITPEERERRRLYAQVYREQHRNKCNEASRKSNQRRRAGEPKLVPGPEKGSNYIIYQPETSRHYKKRVKDKPRLCDSCAKCPCIVGFENLETLGRGKCLDYKPRENNDD